jgi:hypothetical protein
MGLNITITDSQGLATMIGSGNQSVSLDAPTAAQINGWNEVPQVWILPAPFVNNGSTPIAQAPFSVGGGDCLFDTGSLFCFAGAQDAASDNVLMVLWGFPVKPIPNSGQSGQGQLNAPPAAGMLTGGSISWTLL